MLSIFFLLGLVVVGCKGQSNKIFQWQFQNQALSTQLGTCIGYPIVVKPFNTTGNNGVPPYYMISFPIGGIPITTPIGSDPDNLLWTVTQPVGSNLLLSVVDSTGGAGGIPPRLLTVIAGQTTQCVSTPAEPNPSFTVKANVTGNLETCQPWGITVSGGVPPYTITLAQTNQPVVTNVTMDFGANRFTFPNRALPGGSLIAAISDLQGRWANGTPVVTPTGSADTTCTGFVSSSGDAATIDAQDATLNAQLTASKRRKALVAGVVVTLILLVIIGCAAMWYLTYRRRAQIRQKRVSEQRVRQYATTDIPSGISLNSEASGSTQIWETFDTAARPYEAASRVPIYEKRNRIRTDVPVVAVSEPDMQAPPYQEVESSAAFLGRAATGRRAFDRVGGPLRSVSPLSAVPEKSSQFSHQGLPRPVTTAPRSKSSFPDSTPSSNRGNLPSSQQAAGASSTSTTTTSEVVPAFPEAPVSIPAVSPSISPPSGRQTSARFVTFPQKSVRVSALDNLSIASSEENKGADGSSATGNRRGKPPGSSYNIPQMGKASKAGFTRAVEAIAEEDTLPPRDKSTPQ